MKKLFTILAVIIYSFTFFDLPAQTYNGAFYEMFFGSEPSARAEGMGRHLSALPGDPLSYYYNPAGMASVQGLSLNAGFAGPYYTKFDYRLDDSRYNYFGAFYNVKKYGTAGLSMDYFTFGYNEEYIITDEYGNVIGTEKYDPDITNYRLTLSSEVIKDLFVGVNFNLMHPDFDTRDVYTVGNEKMGDDKDVFYFDLGVIKSFNFDSKKLNQDVNLGISIINAFSAEYSDADADYSGKLPVIFRFGASYNLSLNDMSIIPKLKSYNFLLDGEYEDLFNSKYYGGFHAGFEFTFLEILALRAGFYSQENVYRLYNYDTTGAYSGVSETENSITEFTYGFGLNIPIRQLTGGKTPIEIIFDYANLNQPAYKKDNDSPGKSHVYTIIFNWIF